MLPIVELHVHLEGTMPPRLIRELAKRNGLRVPDEYFQNENSFHFQDFMSFIRSYDVMCDFIKTADDLEFITFDYLKSVAESGGIYAELTISPDHAERTHISYPQQLNALTSACERAKQAFGIESRLIVVLVRHEGVAKCKDVLNKVIRNPHPLVVAIGLAGDEQGYPPAQFADLFKQAKDAGLGLTAHAGEWCGPQQILEAVNTLNITRLGHGVRAIEDVVMLKELIAQGIHFEICPGSNVALQVYPSFSQHPLPQFQALGASFSLNSDDPPFFATSVGREYEIAEKEFGFCREQLLQISRNAITASFAPEELKQQLQKKII